MSRFRLMPTPEQEVVLRQHCAHARFVWNLCVEQDSWWRPGRKSAPSWITRGRQLTEARAESDWLRAGSSIVQKQALHDFGQAMASYFAGTHRKPTWRKIKRNEGFRIVGARGLGKGFQWDARRLSRHVGEVRIPKVGWVRFRWSRAVPADAKSYRVTLDPAGRWHIGFTAWPAPSLAGPGIGSTVGVDSGVTVTTALSTGETLNMPRLSPKRQERLTRLQRQWWRCQPNSGRREKVRQGMARLHARTGDARRDWQEKLSTDLAKRFDIIRVEDLAAEKMTRSGRGTRAKPGKHVRQKAGLNREVRAAAWSALVRRLEDKAPGRVEKINPRFTSMTCNACGHCEEGNRKSQAFLCLACGHADHADVNAAKNIARGHRVTARGGSQLGPMKREPQHAA